jgi:Mrp family chromosome partitioning ATPase
MALTDGKGAESVDVSSSQVVAGNDVIAVATRVRLGIRETERCIGVIGVDGHDALGYFAVQLAAGLAVLEATPTLLDDAELSAPVAHDYFGVPSSPGIAELVERGLDVTQCVRASDVPCLSVLPAGTCVGWPAQVFASERCRMAFDELRNAYRRVVVSIGGGSAEGILAADLCDGVVLAIANGRTRDEVVALQRNLAKTRARTVGAVLVHSRRPARSHDNRL